MKKIKSITRGQLILVIFALICVISIYIGINVSSKNSQDKYEEYNKAYLKAGKNYYKILKNLDEIKIKKGGEKRVSLSKLKDHNLLSSELQESGCKGFIKITNEKDFDTDEYMIQYSVCIKCGRRYETDCYEE